MTRRDAIKSGGLALLPFFFPSIVKNFRLPDDNLLAEFGNDFIWGTATAAYQIEGAWDKDGKGPSIWDTFSHIPGNIKDGSNGDVACDFYNKYTEDIDRMADMGLKAFRFSLSWPRILPEGSGRVNEKGIEFYNKVINRCLEKGIEPWVTLYHWDLPQALEDKGGWANRRIVEWFCEYTRVCTSNFGDRVKRWIVLNEPFGFTGLGYGIGYHAPGIKGLSKLMPAIHHAALCQAEGGRVIKEICPQALVGNAFSCSPVDAVSASERDLKAAKRLDALFNRLFIEPACGMGYPINDLPFLKRIEKYILPGDEEKLKFDFDFIGLQNYFRMVGKFSLIRPFIWANVKTADELHAPKTAMDWEIYPEGIYRSIKQFAKYPVKEIVITENGAAFTDIVENNQVHDKQRLAFLQDYIKNVLRAKNEGVNITGYFVWSYIDNFEWAEGVKPRFGLVYNDFNTQQRLLKDSGKWMKKLLKFD